VTIPSLPRAENSQASFHRLGSSLSQFEILNRVHYV
jgi:hypothetical protein